MKINLEIVLSLLIIFAFSSCAYFQTKSERVIDGNSDAANMNSDDGSSGANADRVSPDEITTLPETEPGAIYIIFDASGSMWGTLKSGGRKIDVAKKVLSDFIAGDFSGYDIAFRAYGHRKKDDCTDSEMVVPFGNPTVSIQPMRDFVGSISPLGRTPITYSLREALKDFGSRSGEIILITDGIESCDADPCALIRQWRETNVKIKVHVVGFGLDEKSKDALKCLSDAAGTDYHDAQSPKDLADALEKIRDKAASSGFVLKGIDPAGKEVKVHGTLLQGKNIAYKVSSNGRFQIEAGEYQLEAGVQTVNGNIYRPVTKNLTVAANGETQIRVDVQLPPRVKAKFQDTQVEQQRGSMISIRQNGKEIGKFRPIDEVFIDEGTYEFRANPRGAGEVSVTESFSAGSRKEITFELARTVRVFVKFAAKGVFFRNNTELWQKGIKKYDVHMSNGALVKPGVYDARLPDELTPFEKSGIAIRNKSETINIEVPVGYVTIIYQRRDGSRDKDDRSFMSRADKKQSVFTMTGKPIPLTAGNYTIEGWRQKGNYETVNFTVAVGDNKQIILRAK